MKNYDETIQSIFSKGDAIIEKKRTQIRKIERTSAAVSGLCAAAIVSVSVWRISSSHKLNNNGFSDSNIIDNMDTTTSTTTESTDIATTKTVTSIASTTSKPKTTSKDTTTKSINTSVSLNETSTPVINTTASTKTPIQTTNPITSATAVNTTITQTSQTDIPITSTTTDTNELQEIDLRAILLPNEATLSINDILYEMDNNSLVQSEEINEYIGKYNVKMNVSENVVFPFVLEVYSIKDTEESEAVAVKLTDPDEYYLFRNMDYKKEDAIPSDS